MSTDFLLIFREGGNQVVAILRAGILLILCAQLLSCGGHTASTTQLTENGGKTAGANPAPDPPYPLIAGGHMAVPEALHDLSAITERFRQYISTGELSLVHNLDLEFNSAMNALFLQSSSARPGKEEELKIALLRLNRTMLNLHAASHVSDSVTSADELLHARQQLESLGALYPDSLFAAAVRFPEKFHCPMHPDIAGTKDDLCSKCGMALEPAGFLSREFVKRPPLRASISTVALLESGEEAKAVLHLSQSDGSPVQPGELRIVHTKKIHLLIIDSSLTDYWHVHPQPTVIPGDYAFTFVPRQGGAYRAWADVLPDLTGRQEYVMTDIPAPGMNAKARAKLVSLRSEADSLVFDLTMEGSEILAGKGVRMKLKILRKDGTPFTQLEPIMGAFAHIVGFLDDFRTVIHIHPIGNGPSDPNERGGPELDFHFYSSKPGYLKLFAQVQVAGRSTFAPFGVTILPEIPTTPGRD